jgi:glycosyltransferase involved in cell wall biosynthesis
MHTLRSLHKTVDEVFTVSNYSEQQILKHSNITNVTWFYQNIDQACGAKQVSDLKEKSFLLFVSGNRREKNFARTLDAYLEAVEQNKISYPLCVTGNVDTIKDVINRVARDKKELCERYVRCLGFVSEQEMQWLYAECYFMIYTSKYEGFGLPACNALLYGTPVLSSNLTSIPEVCGSVGCYVDPYSKESIRKGILLLCNDSIYSAYKKRSENYAPVLRQLLNLGSGMMAEKLCTDLDYIKRVTGGE